MNHESTDFARWRFTPRTSDRVREAYAIEHTTRKPDAHRFLNRAMVALLLLCALLLTLGVI